jgi:hypothetical protein
VYAPYLALKHYTRMKLTTVTYTLAFCDRELISAVKSFIAQALGWRGAKTFSITRLSITALSISTLSIITLSLMTLNAYDDCHYAECLLC